MTQPYNLSTSEGGRAFVRDFFTQRLRRHDFTGYITTRLAADFACALAQFLRDNLPSVPRDVHDAAWEAYGNAPTLRDCGRSKVDAAVDAAIAVWESNRALPATGDSKDRLTAITDAMTDHAATKPTQADPVETLDMDRVLSLADVHAEESREDGVRLLDRGGLMAFAQDVAAALAARQPVDLIAQKVGDYRVTVAEDAITVSHGRDIVFAYSAGDPEPISARQPVGEEPLPTGVYYSFAHDNFYSDDGKGMGEAFHMTWAARRNEFPSHEGDAGVHLGMIGDNLRSALKLLDVLQENCSDYTTFGNLQAELRHALDLQAAATRPRQADAWQQRTRFSAAREWSEWKPFDARHGFPSKVGVLEQLHHAEYRPLYAGTPVLQPAPTVGLQQEGEDLCNEAFGEFADDYLTDGNGYAPGSTYAACSAAFSAAWPDRDAAVAAARAELKRLHGDDRTVGARRAEALNRADARDVEDIGAEVETTVVEGGLVGCPDCKTPLLFECPGCSKMNYPEPGAPLTAKNAMSSLQTLSDNAASFSPSERVVPLSVAQQHVRDAAADDALVVACLRDLLTKRGMRADGDLMVLAERVHHLSLEDKDTLAGQRRLLDDVEADTQRLPLIATPAMLDAGWPTDALLDNTFDRQGAYADLIAAAHPPKDAG